MIFEIWEKKENTEIHLNVTKKIFILYVLFRLTNFFEYTVSSYIVQELLPELTCFNNNVIVQHISELYLFCEYLEDRKAIPYLIELFNLQVSDKYERQKFFDLLFLNI